MTGLPAWQQAVVVLGAVAAIVVAGRFLLRPLFRYIADTRLREMFTATALFLVLGIALLMQKLGLSPALGTFIAGVVLAESEYRVQLEADIEPFKGLLLGLFFISVGASIDFSLIAREPATIALIVTGLLAAKFARAPGAFASVRSKTRRRISPGLCPRPGWRICLRALRFRHAECRPPA